MNLVEPLRQKRPPAPALDLYLNEEDFTEEPADQAPLAGPGATPPLPSAMKDPQPAEELLPDHEDAAPGSQSGEDDAEL
jgi:hypothetical protein